MAAPTNSALDAAMAALEAQPYPWFLPHYSIRLTDFAVYTSLVDTYGFGTPVIIGLSPVDAETLTGLTISQDTSYAAQIVVPQIFVHPTSQDVLGTTVSLSDSGGTIPTSYATAYGRSDRVVWEWQCDVQWQPEAVPFVASATGSYEQEVVRYVGDGTSARLIPTTFALDSGVVAVWVCDGVGAGQKGLNCFRHNQSMAGTSIMGNSGYDTTHGIMTFVSGGFTVTSGTLAGFPFANATGHKYTAIVLRDTTTDNRYVQVGTYQGIGSFNLSVNVDSLDGSSCHVSGGGFSPAWNEFLFTYANPPFDFIFSYLSATTAILTPSATALGPLTPLHYDGDNRTVPLATSPIPLSHLWIWGRGVAYRSTDFIGDASVSLASEAYPTADVIQAFADSAFSLGTQNNVNSNGLTYDYLALRFDAAFLAQHLFASFTSVGDAAPPTSVTGFGFTPAVAFGRWFSAVTGNGAIWRGLDHAGTDSTFCGNFGATNDVPVQGISSLDADGVTCGTDIAPTGDTFYGWAFADSGIVTLTVPPEPPYDPIAVPDGAYAPNGGLLGAQGLGFGHTTACGCPPE